MPTKLLWEVYTHIVSGIRSDYILLHAVAIFSTFPIRSLVPQRTARVQTIRGMAVEFVEIRSFLERRDGTKAATPQPREPGRMCDSKLLRCVRRTQTPGAVRICFGTTRGGEFGASTPTLAGASTGL